MTTTPKNLFRGKIKKNWSSDTGGPNSGSSAVAYGNGQFVALPNASTASNVFSTNPSVDGTTWTSRVGLNPTVSWVAGVSSATSAKGFLTVAANSNVVAWSSGALATTWTYMPSLPVAANWTSIAMNYNSNTGVETVVVVASGSNIACTSTDWGQTWTQRTLPASANWTSVTGTSPNGATPTYTPTAVYGVTFFAVASGTNQGARSTDGGATWTAITLPWNVNWSSVAWYPATTTMAAVASGTNQAAYSINGGSTWSASTMPSSAQWSSLKFRIDATAGSGTVSIGVAVSNGTATAYTSNGTTWTAGPALPANTTWSVAWGNTTWMAVGSGSTTGAYITEPVGNTWSSNTLPATGWQGLFYNAGSSYFVAVGSNGVATHAYNSGAAAWTSPNYTPNAYWAKIAYGASNFVATAERTTGWDGSAVTAQIPTRIAVTSPDGINWTLRSLPSNDTWGPVAYGNNTYVVLSTQAGANVSNGTAAASSADNGATWIARTVPAANWRAAAYGNGVFVAVSATSVAATSTDGATWTARTMPTLPSGQWFGVAFGNGIFVATASAGYFATSTDGINWTLRSGSGVYVVFGGGQFFSPASSMVGFSVDGINWSYRGSATLTLGSGNAFGGGQFVALSPTTASAISGYSDDTFVLYTAPAGVTTVLTDVLVLAPSTSAVNFTIRVGSEDLLALQTLAAAGTVSLPTRQVLNPGDTVVGYVINNAQPSVHLNGVEITNS